MTATRIIYACLEKHDNYQSEEKIVFFSLVLKILQHTPVYKQFQIALLKKIEMNVSV